MVCALCSYFNHRHNYLYTTREKCTIQEFARYPKHMHKQFEEVAAKWNYFFFYGFVSSSQIVLAGYGHCWCFSFNLIIQESDSVTHFLKNEELSPMFNLFFRLILNRSRRLSMGHGPVKLFDPRDSFSPDVWCHLKKDGTKHDPWGW